MSIEGRIAIDVSFSDTASDTGMQALKRLALTSTDAYTSGQMVLVSGTCGTANVAIALAPTTYRDASGALVSFASVSRYAFSCSRRAMLTDGSMYVYVDGSRAGVFDAGNTAASSVTIDPQFTSGTASYSLVIVGT